MSLMAPDLSELIECREDFKILFTKNTDEHHKTVVVKTISRVRAAIMSTSLIYIGTKRCRVFDRYWVSRCTKCQSYNHKTTSCQQKYVCGFCAGEHKTNGCKNKNLVKCHNCILSGRHDSNHSSFSTTCPIFSAIRSNIIARTDLVVNI